MKLPINQILNEANVTIKENFSLLLKRLFLSSILFLPILSLFGYITESDEVSPYLVLFSFFAYFIVFIFFAITIHRIVLLGESSVPVYGHFSWSKKEWMFLLYIFIIEIFLSIFLYIILFVMKIMYLFASPVFSFSINWLMIFHNKTALLFWVLAILLLAFISILIYRLSMVFPALAIDKKKISLQWAMKITKDNGWRLFCINSMPVIISFFLFDVSTFFEHIENLLGIYVSTILILLTMELLTIYQIILISLSFKYLEKHKNH